MKCKSCSTDFDFRSPVDLPKVLGYCNQCSRKEWAGMLHAHVDHVFPCTLLDSRFLPPTLLASANLGVNCPTYWQGVAGIGEHGVSIGMAKKYGPNSFADPSVAL